MLRKTVETRARTTKDGRLKVSVDVDVADADVDVVVTVTPVTTGAVDGNGWRVLNRMLGRLRDATNSNGIVYPVRPVRCWQARSSNPIHVECAPTAAPAVRDGGHSNLKSRSRFGEDFAARVQSQWWA